MINLNRLSQRDFANARRTLPLAVITALTLALFSLAPSAWSGSYHKHRTQPGISITEVFVTFADPAHGGVDTITIRGKRFGRRPQVKLGSFPDPLMVLSASASEIVAECPMTLVGPACPTGDYRLRVTTGRGKDRRTGKLSLTIGTPSDAPALQAQIDAQQAQIAALQAYIDLLQTYLQIDDGTTPPRVTFAGANVHIVNGQGSTDTINGSGNLIVGYDERRNAFFGDSEKTGSHNLIIGTGHNYTSYGGAVFGRLNAVSGPEAGVTGGLLNIASGPRASVSGGQGNIANGSLSSVSGGENNEASGQRSSVSGGNDNTASGEFSSVSAGGGNTASGVVSSVSGGLLNTASGARASVSGGRENAASTADSSVSGGFNRSVQNGFDWRAGSLLEDF